MSDGADTAKEIDAIFQRDAEIFRAISRHGFRARVRFGFSDAPKAEVAEPERTQADTALLTAIARTRR